MSRSRNYSEVTSKVGGAIDNCGYVDDKSVEALFELACKHAHDYGVTPKQINEWVATHINAVYNKRA